jgi:hypothetical protein
MIAILPAVIMGQISPIFILNRSTHLQWTSLTYNPFCIRNSDLQPRGQLGHILSLRLRHQPVGIRDPL